MLRSAGEPQLKLVRLKAGEDSTWPSLFSVSVARAPPRSLPVL